MEPNSCRPQENRFFRRLTIINGSNSLCSIKIRLVLLGKVMWSDESIFSLFQNDGCNRVRKEPRETVDSSYIVQAYGGSIMIWGFYSGFDL
ncbi:hypothetical protein AVEN_28173-1 [Araneus ventricosus]|uniref:Uncharacterized protein n=1 Tax=Araneus ventricosus TaxID=182803 RepID=A0A4Y2VI48_ARAVE|nr:hypothetical protein AVEN_232366-1 [Araneus ventricosus]GBO24969.1 hypothetical protein AVEN_28173-1 [Araneus ventricosus]